MDGNLQYIDNSALHQEHINADIEDRKLARIIAIEMWVMMREQVQLEQQIHLVVAE